MSGQIALVTSMMNEFRSNDEARSNASSKALAEWVKNPDIFPILHEIYKQNTTDVVLKRTVLICYRAALVHLFAAGPPPANVLKFVQDSLMDLEAIETDQSFLSEISILSVMIFSRTKQGWESLDNFLKAEPTNLENYLNLLTHYLSQVSPVRVDLLEIAVPRIENAFQRGFGEQMNAFCLLATAKLCSSEGAMMFERFIPAIQQLYTKVFEAETEQRVSVFFTALSFCMRFADDEGLIERICPTIQVIETVTNPGLSYTSRILIREYLNERFLQMSPSEGDAISVLDEMIKLGIWLYTSEIDEATSTIDDFVPIFNWFPRGRGVPLFLERVQSLVSQGRPEMVCTALDLIRAVIAKNGDLPGVCDFVCECLKLPDFRLKSLAAALLKDYQGILQGSIVANFERIVGIVIDWAHDVAKLELSVDREEFSIPAISLLIEIIHVNMNLDSVFEAILALATHFMSRGTINEQYHATILLAHACETNTVKVSEHIQAIATTILDQLPTCRDDSIRSVCYVTVPVLALRCKSIVVERLPSLVSQMAKEESIEARVRAVEMVGRLVGLLDEVRQFLGPVVEMSIEMITSMTHEDPINWEQVSALLIALSSIVSICADFIPTSVPVIFSTLRTIVRAREPSALLKIPKVFRFVLGILPQELIDDNFSILISEISILVSGEEVKLRDDVAAALIETMSDLIEQIDIDGAAMKEKLVRHVLGVLKSLVDDFEYKDEKIRLGNACSRFLQAFILRTPEMAPLIGEIFDYSISVLDSDSTTGKPISCLLLSAIASITPEFIKPAQWTRILQHCLGSLHCEARCAKNASYLLKTLVKSIPSIRETNGQEILAQVSQALNQETPDIPDRLYLQDTLVGTFSTLAQSLNIPFDQYLEVVERFLPVVTDVNELEDVYSYITGSFANASAGSKQKIFAICVRLSCLRTNIVYYLKEGNLTLETCLRIWEILKSGLDAAGDAKAAVAEILGQDQESMREFADFLNLLTMIEQNQPSFSSE